MCGCVDSYAITRGLCIIYVGAVLFLLDSAFCIIYNDEKFDYIFVVINSISR